MSAREDESFSKREWAAWSTIDTVFNLPGWWRWVSMLMALAVPTALTWWTAALTHWPLPVIITFGIGALGATLFALTQISIRAWLSATADNARRGTSRTDDLPLRLSYLDRNVGAVMLSATNDGPTDSFVAQITYQTGTRSYLRVPFQIRWQGNPDAKQEIVCGQTQHLHVLEFVTDPENPSFECVDFCGQGRRTEQLTLLAYSGTIRLYEQLEMSIRLMSATTGRTKNVSLLVLGFFDGMRFQTRAALSELERF